MNGALPAHPARQAPPYRGSYLVGFLLLGVAALRAIIAYQGRPQLAAAMALMAVYGLLYAAEPLLAARLRWIPYLYFPVQIALLLVLTNLRPFLDNSCSLYIPLWVQTLHAFPRRVAMVWMGLLAILMSATLILGMGSAEGAGLALVMLAGAAFLVSYDLLYAQRRADQAASEALLDELRQAHHRLQEHTAQAEELAAARERNRLAREMHDSVSQVVFGISLTAQAARLLLDRDPERVPQQLDRLQEMTGSALVQLRSLIAQLRPPHST
jgi:signal transduction histidine kinase